VGTPRAAAMARPAASERLLMTPTTRPAMPPSRSASRIAAMFEPRPEMRMTTRFIVETLSECASCDDGGRHTRSSALDPADRICRFALCPEARYRGLGVGAGYDQDQPYAAVEHPMHFRERDVAAALQPVKNRRRRPARLVDARDQAGWHHPVGV